jgi:hypothetical protein
MRYFVAAVFVVIAVPIVFACDFKYDPVSVTQFYRSEGWALPGIEDNPLAAVETYRLPRFLSIPGAKPQVIRHEFPYIVGFPAQDFELKGARQKMRAAQMKVSIVRWVIYSRIVAYSYGLTPVTAHQDKNKWVIDSEAACIFDVTFIDDKGDGIFRVMVHGPLASDLVPSWARAKKD